MSRRSNGPWFYGQKNTWYAWHEGKRVSLKVQGEGNDAEAMRAWHRFKADGCPTPKPKPEPTLTPTPKLEPTQEPKPIITINSIVDGFLADAASRLKPPTLRLYRSHLKPFVKAVGSMKPEALTPKHIASWLHSFPHGSTTKSMMLRSVSACFSWGISNDLMTTNPARKVPKPKSKSRSVEAVITREQHDAMFAIALPAQRQMLVMLHDTGCRPGEACKVTAETFHLDAGCIILHDHKAERTGKPRVIFLSPELVELFKVQAESRPKGSLLRTSWGTPWNAQSVRLMVSRLAERCGFKAMPYGYRHSFATSALANGVPDATVAALLGHSSTAMLHRHYSHLTSQATVLREALSRVRG